MRSDDVTRAGVTSPLQRLLAPARPIALVEGADPGEMPGPFIHSPSGEEPFCWLTHEDWRVYARPRRSPPVRGERFAEFELGAGSAIAATWDAAAQSVFIPFSLTEAFDAYVSEDWREVVRQRALSQRQLDVFYAVKRAIPRSWQLAARRVLARRQSAPEFPAWPLDRSMLRLLGLYARSLAMAGRSDEIEFSWFWPDAHAAACILTHDVESAEGLSAAVGIADLEQDRGLRSSFNVVADWYPIDHGVLGELRGRGFEIGVHGVHHDRSMFSSREEFDAQRERVAEAARAFHAVGFRSPSTHRVYEWLGDLPVSYDCTIPHSDPFEPQPGGCCSVWPFFIGSVVELPYTLPQDHTTFTLLAHDTISLWRRQLDAVAGMNGLIQCVSHPDAGYLGRPGPRSLYTEFLDVLAARADLWHALPRDVAAWWRARDDPAADGLGRGVVQFGDHLFDVSFSPAADPVSA